MAASVRASTRASIASWRTPTKPSESGGRFLFTISRLHMHSIQRVVSEPFISSMEVARKSSYASESQRPSFTRGVIPQLSAMTSMICGTSHVSWMTSIAASLTNWHSFFSSSAIGITTPFRILILSLFNPRAEGDVKSCISTVLFVLSGDLPQKANDLVHNRLPLWVTREIYLRLTHHVA